MTGFQYGDGQLMIGGQAFALRLTLGGLAELDQRFGISGPKDLAARLRFLAPQDGRTLLEVLLSCPLSQDAKSLAAMLSDADITAALPKLCRVIEAAFGEIHA